jgi:hypothetical protein
LYRQANLGREASGHCTFRGLPHTARDDHSQIFLHVSRKEQKNRFIERLDQPDKRWKFSAADMREREFWDDYMHAFEEAMHGTASKQAPWFVVPADNKWFTRLVVVAAIVQALESLDLAYPKVNSLKKKELAAARAALAKQT